MFFYIFLGVTTYHIYIYLLMNPRTFSENLWAIVVDCKFLLRKSLDPYGIYIIYIYDFYMDIYIYMSYNDVKKYIYI